MNDTPRPSIEELQEQVRSLRTFFLATLAVLIFLSFTLDVFILRQVSIARRQLEENQKFVDDYNKISVPMITDFLTKLTAASKTNTDIARLLLKYNIQQPVAKPVPATLPAHPATTPLTAPAPAPKK
ncbi:MAG: hypothetical protein HY298_16490 [Verrucomicrobia bacterium]|nr:hypothetical protein [Verrucomicrobiota bacterium]